MSDTPLTDNIARGNHVVPTEFAQDLERERNEARNCFKAAMEMAETYKRERDEAREALRSFVQKMRDQAAVFKREDLRDNSRWSIFNEGRAQALEKFAEDLEVAK